MLTSSSPQSITSVADLIYNSTTNFSHGGNDVVKKYEEAGQMIERAFADTLRSLTKEDAKELTLFRGSHDAQKDLKAGNTKAA